MDEHGPFTAESAVRTKELFCIVLLSLITYQKSRKGLCEQNEKLTFISKMAVNIIEKFFPLYFFTLLRPIKHLCS